jgi:hypothetical protein
MNSTRLSNLAVVLGSGNEYSDEDESSLETITSVLNLHRLDCVCQKIFKPFLSPELAYGSRWYLENKSDCY